MENDSLAAPPSHQEVMQTGRYICVTEYCLLKYVRAENAAGSI